MSVLRRNTIANMVGNGWAAVMGLAFIPLYVRFLGIEAFGLLGFFAALQAVLSLLDLGLGAALNREVARLAAREEPAQLRDLVRTLEIIYWFVGVLVALVVVLLSPILAGHWVNAEGIPVETLQRVILLMGLTIAVRWPFALYSGGLLGLQRQVLYNGLRMPLDTLRNGGVVLVLWLVSPTLQAFFYWQIAAGAVTTLLLGAVLWRVIPGPAKTACFRVERLRETWRFAAGMSGIAVTVLLLTQIDKIILVRLLSLEAFGYYALASAAAAGLVQISSPVFSAFYPRLTHLVTVGDEEELRRVYHLGAQLLSILMLSATTLIALFSAELLLLWTQDATVAATAAPLLSLLIIGTGLNGVMSMPYALQLASGWTRLALYTNIAAVFVLIPLLILLAERYGAIGAAAVWPVLNLGYVVIGVQLTHRRLLRGEARRWYLQDFGFPLVTAVLIAGSARLLLPDQLSMPSLAAALVAIGCATSGAAAFSTPSGLNWLRTSLQRRFAHGNR
jgi:O-antigen/teichoic acid export membrane protein